MEYGAPAAVRRRTTSTFLFLVFLSSKGTAWMPRTGTHGKSDSSLHSDFPSAKLSHAYSEKIELKPSSQQFATKIHLFSYLLALQKKQFMRSSPDVFRAFEAFEKWQKALSSEKHFSEKQSDGHDKNVTCFWQNFSV
jgi:hypothetical protein